MSKFKIGQVCKQMNGMNMTVLAICADGRLIVQNSLSPEGTSASIRNADGRFPDRNCTYADLIGPDEPTAEEREWLARLYEAINFSNLGAGCIRNQTYDSGSHCDKFVIRILPIIRELKLA